MRHRQTKGPVSARLYLHRRATPRLHLKSPGVPKTSPLRSFEAIDSAVSPPPGASSQKELILKRQGCFERIRDFSPVDMLNFLENQRSSFRVMTTLDVLIAIPVVPLVPVFIAWPLPWERWIPWGNLPKLVLGPYVLYAGFAAWHFHFSVWFVLLVVAAGAILTVIGAVEKVPATLPSTTDKKFLKSLEDWLRGQSEIMILVRYSRTAGNKSFEFFTSFAALRKRLGS